jgi:hypothetical protein
MKARKLYTIFLNYLNSLKREWILEAEFSTREKSSEVEQPLCCTLESAIAGEKTVAAAKDA